MYWKGLGHPPRPSHFIGICCVKAILCQEAQDIPPCFCHPFPLCQNDLVRLAHCWDVTRFCVLNLPWHLTVLAAHQSACCCTDAWLHCLTLRDPEPKFLWSKSIQLKLHGIWRQVLHTQRCSDVVTDWRQHILTNCSCHLRTWHFFQALHLLRFASCLPSLLGFFVLAGLACKEAKIVRYSTIVLLKSYWALAALAVWVLHPEVFDPAWSKEEFTMTAVTLDHDQPINQWLLRMLHSAATQAIHAIAASLWMAFCQWSLLEVRNGFELSAPQDSSRRWTVSA